MTQKKVKTEKIHHSFTIKKEILITAAQIHIQYSLASYKDTFRYLVFTRRQAEQKGWRVPERPPWRSSHWRSIGAIGI